MTDVKRESRSKTVHTKDTESHSTLPCSIYVVPRTRSVGSRPNCARGWRRLHCCSRVKARGQDASLNLLHEATFAGRSSAKTQLQPPHSGNMQQPLANVVGESLPFNPTMDSTDLSVFLIDSGIPREVCDVLESKF